MKLINNPFATHGHKDAGTFVNARKRAATSSMIVSSACGWGNESPCKHDEWMASHILADTRSIPGQTRSRDCSLFAPQLFCNHCYSNNRCKRKTEHAVTLIAPKWLDNRKAIISGNLCFFICFRWKYSKKVSIISGKPCFSTYFRWL